MAELSYARGAALVVGGAVLWSLMGLAIRAIGEATTWQILFWRSLGLAPVVLLFIAWRSGWRPLARLRAAGAAGVTGGAALVFAFAGAIYAIQATTVANAVFLFAASPLITAVLAWPVLREPVRAGTWVAILLAVIGIALMVREGLALGALSGNLAALGSAAGFAVFTLALRRGRTGDMFPATFLGGLFAMLTAAAVLAASGQGLAIPPRDAALAVGMGVLLLGGGLVAFTLGSRAVPAADLALLSMVEVMLAPVWVWLFLGETAGAGTLVGGAVLLAALALNALTGMRHRHITPT
ncbi:MAG: DMT family transporter [Rhodobacteraceae bacterium]|nr:DMT family transporter [Paracoccaceae bacterium]